MKKNILILFNTTSNDRKIMSGGSQMLIQIFKRIRDKFDAMYCCTNSSGKAVMEKEIKNVDFVISSKTFDKCNLFVVIFLKQYQRFPV